MSLSEKLKVFGIKRFGSVNAFAKALGMSQPSLSAYLHGKREPGAVILKRLKDNGCDINWLLADDDPVNTGIEEKVNPPPEINDNGQDRILQLEEENRILRDSITHILELTQAVEDKKTEIKKRLKKMGLQG